MKGAPPMMDERGHHPRWMKGDPHPRRMNGAPPRRTKGGTTTNTTNNGGTGDRGQSPTLNGTTTHPSLTSHCSWGGLRVEGQRWQAGHQTWPWQQPPPLPQATARGVGRGWDDDGHGCHSPLQQQQANEGVMKGGFFLLLSNIFCILVVWKTSII